MKAPAYRTEYDTLKRFQLYHLAAYSIESMVGICMCGGKDLSLLCCFLPADNTSVCRLSAEQWRRMAAP